MNFKRKFYALIMAAVVALTVFIQPVSASASQLKPDGPKDIPPVFTINGPKDIPPVFIGK